MASSVADRLAATADGFPNRASSSASAGYAARRIEQFVVLTATPRPHESCAVQVMSKVFGGDGRYVRARRSLPTIKISAQRAFYRKLSTADLKFPGNSSDRLTLSRQAGASYGYITPYMPGDWPQ